MKAQEIALSVPWKICRYTTKKTAFLSFSDKFAVFFIGSVFLQPLFYAFRFDAYIEITRSAIENYKAHFNK